MPSKNQAELEALRQRLADQNRRWEEAKSLLVGSRRVVAVTPEALAAIDCACEAPVRATHRAPEIHPGAIRA